MKIYFEAESSFNVTLLANFNLIANDSHQLPAWLNRSYTAERVDRFEERLFYPNPLPLSTDYYAFNDEHNVVSIDRFDEDFEVWSVPLPDDAATQGFFEESVSEVEPFRGFCGSVRNRAKLATS